MADATLFNWRRGSDGTTYIQHPNGTWLRVAQIFQPEQTNNWGKSWRNRRPPGLPANAPRASEEGSAYGPVAIMAGWYGLGPEFESALMELLDNESSGTIGRPANIFNWSDECRRAPRSVCRSISAWGAWQFNKGAIQRLSRSLDYLHPQVRKPSAPPWVADIEGVWELSPFEALYYPVDHYARIYATLLLYGADVCTAKRGLHLMHSGPAYYTALIAALRRDPATAWATFPELSARNIDQSDANGRARAAERINDARERQRRITRRVPC